MAHGFGRVWPMFVYLATQNPAMEWHGMTRSCPRNSSEVQKDPMVKAQYLWLPSWSKLPVAPLPGATRRCSWVIGPSFTWTAWMIRSRPTWCPPSYVQKKNGWRLRSPVVTWRMSEAPWKNLRAVRCCKGWSCLRPQPKLLNSVHMHFLCCLYIFIYLYRYIPVV
jgi:hypothetical protein